MMTDPILKLALSSIKKEKENYLVIFLIMLLSFSAVITVYNIAFNENKRYRMKRKEDTEAGISFMKILVKKS